MKVLLILDEAPIRHLLITLLAERYISEVKDLISKSKYANAISKVCSLGRFERYVADDELQAVDADLMLTASNARWEHC